MSTYFLDNFERYRLIHQHTSKHGLYIEDVFDYTINGYGEVYHTKQTSLADMTRNIVGHDRMMEAKHEKAL